jgi:hypothetical protein
MAPFEIDNKIFSKYVYLYSPMCNTNAVDLCFIPPTLPHTDTLEQCISNQVSWPKLSSLSKKFLV